MIDYGTDVACPMGDADELFSEITGIGVVVQDCIHILTQDDFLGPGGDARGFDLRRLLGQSMDSLAGRETVLEEVLLRDDRITLAKVVLSKDSIAVSAMTGLGPFSFTLPLADLIMLGDVL